MDNPKDRSPFSFLYMKRECFWGAHPKPTEPGDSGIPSLLRATALLVKATEEIGVGSPLTIVPHALEALLNSHHT